MSNYDVIIIGAGIAGLGVGGILQDNGLKTLILEKSKIAGGRCKTFDFPGGWKVDSGTHAIDDGEYSACGKLLEKVGKKIPWTRNIQGGMFYSDGDWKPMMEYLALTEADKKQMAEFEEWMKNISDEELDQLDKISLSQLIEEKSLSARIAEFVKTVGMVQTTLTDANIISAGEFVSIYGKTLLHSPENAQPFSQVRMPLGGIVTMIKALEDAYKEKGGTLYSSTAVRKVNVKPGGQTEIVTDKEIFQAANVVIAVPIWQMLKILSMDEMANFVPKWAARLRTLERETSSSLGFTIGTKAPLLDAPYYLSAWRLPNVDLPLQILLHTNFDDTIAPKNHTIAFIGACCTPDEAENKEFREKTLTAFWEIVKKMFPNVEADLVWRQDAFIVGIDGLARSPGMTGKLRPPVHLPEVPGLYFAGDCYTGRGVGMNAASNSAMICADSIISKISK